MKRRTTRPIEASPSADHYSTSIIQIELPGIAFAKLNSVSPRGGADFTETRAREGQELDRVVFSRWVIQCVQDGSRLRGRQTDGVESTPSVLT